MRLSRTSATFLLPIPDSSLDLAQAAIGETGW
jgi:hypothetical protein